MKLRGTSRKDFQRLAEREARALLAAGEFDGAYYLAGYAIECALKAVIAKAIAAETLLKPEDLKKVHQHNLESLLEHAELGPELKAAVRVPAWATVSGWNEQVRYQDGRDQSSAEQMLEAIENPTTGILPWLTHRW